MLRRRSDVVACVLAVLISLPAFALGHLSRVGYPMVAELAVLVLAMVVVASAIMKQIE